MCVCVSMFCAFVCVFNLGLKQGKGRVVPGVYSLSRVIAMLENFNSFGASLKKFWNIVWHTLQLRIFSNQFSYGNKHGLNLLVCKTVLSNTVDHCPAKAKTSPVSQKIPPILWNPNVHFYIYKNLLSPIMSQMNRLLN